MLFSAKQAEVGKAFLAETFHFEREMKEKKDIFQGKVKKEYYSKSY